MTTNNGDVFESLSNQKDEIKNIPSKETSLSAPFGTSNNDSDFFLSVLNQSIPDSFTKVDNNPTINDSNNGDSIHVKSNQPKESGAVVNDPFSEIFANDDGFSDIEDSITKNKGDNFSFLDADDDILDDDLLDDDLNENHPYNQHNNDKMSQSFAFLESDDDLLPDEFEEKVPVINPTR